MLKTKVYLNNALTDSEVNIATFSMISKTIATKSLILVSESALFFVATIVVTLLHPSTQAKARAFTTTVSSNLVPVCML